MPCLERGCIHDVFLRVGRRKTVLVISNSCSAHFLKRRSPLLLHFPTPSDPITPFQVWWSVPTLSLKSPKRISLSVRGAAEVTESRSSYNLSLTSSGWSLCVHRHLQLLHASCQIWEVSASSGSHLCLLEVLRACWRGVTWWRILLLLHAALLSCVHSRRKCSQHQLLLKALLLQGESHSELQSRLCIGEVLYQLELFFAQSVRTRTVH